MAVALSHACLSDGTVKGVMADIAPRVMTTRLGEVSMVVVLWVALFELNRWLFSFAVTDPFVSWVFLPAALRVVAILVLGWRGALGLFVGALITNQPVIGVNLLDALALSAISAGAPLLAVECTKRWLGVGPDLAGLTFKQLLTIAATGAVTSSVMHNVYFNVRHEDHEWVDGLVPMLGGDMVGTLAVLYVSVLLIRRAPTRPD